MLKANLFKLDYFKRIHNVLLIKERREGFFILILLLIGVLLETIGIGLILPALALFTQKNIAKSYPLTKPVIDFFGNPDQSTLIIGGLLILFFFYFIKAAFLIFLSWAQNHFIYSIDERLSHQLFHTYLHQPYTFHLERNSAQLIKNITTEVEVFANNVITPSMQLVAESLTFLCIFTLLVIVEPQGTMNIVIILGLSSLLFVLLTRHNITKWGNARLYHDGLRIQHLQQGLGGIKDVKLLGKEYYFLQQYGMHNSTCSKVKRLNNTVQQMPRYWLEFLAVTGLIILALTMLAHGMTIDRIVPSLGFFAVATFRMLPSVNRALTATQLLQYCLPVLDIIGNDFSLPTNKPIQPQNTKSEFNSTLQVKDISYSYPNTNKPAVDQVSFIIHKGESIGFIGPSGSGKSTLIDIILGLISPDKGTVMIDGKNITDIMRPWQNLIGYVPQSIYLTDNDLVHNIAFGIDNELINLEKVWECIRSANLETFVAGLPEGLNTFVGERGVRLSGGQRQRIGIARALYHNPEVLVLDEATSALDNDSESAVMEAVTSLRGTKTLIIIAHRLSTVEHCDRIFKLVKGRVESAGGADTMVQGIRVAK